MSFQIINRSRGRIPRALVNDCLSYAVRSLVGRKIKGIHASSQVVVVFLPLREARRLNRQYRQRDYATDVLSFESIDGESLGEIVLSLDVVRTQARAHRLGVGEELSYLLIHGLLHLLGFDHEGSAKEAKRMFQLQDRIWNAYWRDRQ